MASPDAPAVVGLDVIATEAPLASVEVFVTSDPTTQERLLLLAELGPVDIGTHRIDFDWPPAGAALPADAPLRLQVMAVDEARIDETDPCAVPVGGQGSISSLGFLVVGSPNS